MTQATEVRSWTPTEFKRRLDALEPMAVLDVREHDERRHCAIPLPEQIADLHVPIGEVTDRLEALRMACDGRPLVVYCHHGTRSLATARWLVDRGLDAPVNLEGGIDAWSLTVDPGIPRY